MRKLSTPTVLLFSALALQGLAGCEPVAPPEVAPEIRAAVEARRVNYKEIGGAFKTITDEIKTGIPNLDTIGPMAREIRTRAADQLNYFPSGSGIGSGAETKAKAVIWSDFGQFTSIHEKFLAAADRLGAAVQTGDLTSLPALHGEVGATCKECHDRFREAD